MVPDQENVGSLLDKIAEYRTGVGMKYLEEAVRRVLEKGEFPAKGLMQLYGEIGAPDGVSDRTVSRAIAKSVKQILEYGKLQVLLNRIGMNDVTPGDVRSSCSPIILPAVPLSCAEKGHAVLVTQRHRQNPPERAQCSPSRRILHFAYLVCFAFQL